MRIFGGSSPRELEVLNGIHYGTKINNYETFTCTDGGYQPRSAQAHYRTFRRMRRILYGNDSRFIVYKRRTV